MLRARPWVAIRAKQECRDWTLAYQAPSGPGDGRDRPFGVEDVVANDVVAERLERRSARSAEVPQAAAISGRGAVTDGERRDTRGAVRRSDEAGVGIAGGVHACGREARLTVA